MDAGIPLYGFELCRSYYTTKQNIRLRVEQLVTSWRWWKLILSLPSDIDECSQSIGNLCTFQCVNVDGSYKCSCPAHGYVLSANGHTCRGEWGLSHRLTAAVENLHQSHWEDHVSVLGACVVSLKKNFSFKPSMMALQLHACMYVNTSSCCLQMLMNAKLEATTVHWSRRATTSKVASGVSPSVVLPTTRGSQTRKAQSP